MSQINTLNRIQWGFEIRPFAIHKHLKSDFLKVVFKMVGPYHSKLECFCLDFKYFFLQNGGHLSRFQLVGLPDFWSHSKSIPFATQSLFGHSKSRLVGISDPHCKNVYFLAHAYNIQQIVTLVGFKILRQKNNFEKLFKVYLNFLCLDKFRLVYINLLGKQVSQLANKRLNLRLSFALINT